MKPSHPLLLLLTLTVVAETPACGTSRGGPGDDDDGGAEICDDGIDNDGDGTVDEGEDEDGDGLRVGGTRWLFVNANWPSRRCLLQPGA